MKPSEIKHLARMACNSAYKKQSRLLFIFPRQSLPLRYGNLGDFRRSEQFSALVHINTNYNLYNLYNTYMKLYVCLDAIAIITVP